MSGYPKNLWLYFSGFFRLGSLSYKPGWGPFKFFFLYLIDHGFNVLVLGNQVVTVSRYAWIRRTSQPWKWLGETLDKIQPNHIENAGDPLWGSVPNPPWQRIAVPILWIGLIVFLTR